MKVYKLNKAVFNLKNNVTQFLQGLASNDLDKPHNAFVTIHGRIVATFDQLHLSDDEVVILVEEPFVDGLLKHIDRFVKLSGVKMERIKRNVYFDLDDKVPSPGPGEGQDWTIPQKRGKIIVTERVLESNVSDEEFRLFRLKNHIPQQGVDYTDEFLLNVGEVFVSFTKGCFLGQEPIAKVHNRSKPSSKLVLRYEDECTSEEKEKMTSKTLEHETRRVLGFIFVKNE